MVEYTFKLLKDFDDLLTSFRWFMTMQLIHADTGLTGEKRKKMKEYIIYCLALNEKLKIFKMPLDEHETENKEIFQKKFHRFLEDLAKWLVYSDELLRVCHPEIYQKGFRVLKNKYAHFRHVYQI